MTDPDTYGKRGAASGILDMNRRLPMRDPDPLPRFLGERAGNLAQLPPPKERALPPQQPQQPPEHPADIPDIEHIARWFKILSYDDMKTWATAVVGEGEIKTPADLADRVNEWQKKTISKVAA